MDIPRAKATAICGEDGSGKTSLLLTLAGRMASNEGSLSVDDLELPKARGKVQRLSGLGFFEHVNEVQPNLSIQALVAAELGLYGLRSNKEDAQGYLDRWGLLDKASTRAGELTAEDRVRFGIALGMVSEPEMLAVDDIEQRLTHHQSRKLMQYLCNLARDGLTVLVACTEYEIARGADAVVLLSEAVVADRSRVEGILDERRSQSYFSVSAIKDAPPVVGGCVQAYRVEVERLSSPDEHSVVDVDNATDEPTIDDAASDFNLSGAATEQSANVAGSAPSASGAALEDSNSRGSSNSGEGATEGGES